MRYFTIFFIFKAQGMFNIYRTSQFGQVTSQGLRGHLRLTVAILDGATLPLSQASALVPIAGRVRQVSASQ